MRVKVAALALIGAILAIGVFVLAYVQGASYMADSDASANQVRQCEAYSLRLTSPGGKPTVQDLSNISVYCYNDVRRLQLLSSSIINRGNYVHQRFENNIILVMVVIITCSGVGLAGLQLLTSYRLSLVNPVSSAESSELVIERGRLALRSSVTGILVLGLSLAFFFVYVLWVYTIRETKVENVIEVEQAVPHSLSAAPAENQSTGIQPNSPPAIDIGTMRVPNGRKVKGTRSNTTVKLLPGGFGLPPSNNEVAPVTPK